MSRAGNSRVIAEADRRAMTVSEMYREIFKLGWETYTKGGK